MLRIRYSEVLFSTATFALQFTSKYDSMSTTKAATHEKEELKNNLDDAGV